MDNESVKIEEEILNKNLASPSSKSNSKKIFYVIAGLLILGVVTLYGGIKILSYFSVSASTEDAPPTPPDPTYELSQTITVSATVTSSADAPPTPPAPCESSKTFTIPSGWSLVSGMQLEGKDLSEIARKGIFIYSFNDPSPGLQNRSWVASDPYFTNQADYLSVGTYKVWPQTFVGYYAYNPGAASSFTLGCISSTNPGLSNSSSLIYGRGWHLVYWPGVAQTRDQLLNNFQVFYNDKTSRSLTQAISESEHKASIKIYVVVNQEGINQSSIKELTGTDSSTTISKLPANSYFWVYLRRTKSRAIQLGPLSAEINNPVPSASSTTTSATKDNPPVPPSPTS